MYKRQPYGPVRVSWEHGEDAGVLQIETPPNTQAQILLEPYIDVQSHDGLEFTAEGGVQRAAAGSGIRTIKYGIDVYKRQGQTAVCTLPARTFSSYIFLRQSAAFSAMAKKLLLPVIRLCRQAAVKGCPKL